MWKCAAVRPSCTTSSRARLPQQYVQPTRPPWPCPCNMCVRQGLRRGGRITQQQFSTCTCSRPFQIKVRGTACRSVAACHDSACVQEWADPRANNDRVPKKRALNCRRCKKSYLLPTRGTLQVTDKQCPLCQYVHGPWLCAEAGRLAHDAPPGTPSCAARTAATRLCFARSASRCDRRVGRRELRVCACVCDTRACYLRRMCLRTLKTMRAVR